MKVNLVEIEVGDIFSEESHYIVKEVKKDSVVFEHLESGKTVSLSNEYVHNMLNTSDQYEKEVKVTKEDKKDGTKGIRSIFEGIHSSQVFTVCFKKQDKVRSKKAINTEIEAKTEAFVEAVNRAKSQKKSISDVAKKHFNDLLVNPILGFEEGEERVLRGYKIQFESRDGRYDCVDMDIERTDKESGIRPVNINTIKWLVFNGVKYIVE